MTRDERNWKRADEFALRSMSQTRAMSKALRAPLGFVVALGGLSTTPGEEVDEQTGEVAPAAGELPAWAKDIDDEAINRMGDNLTAVVAAAGVDIAPEQVAAGVGNRLVKFTGGTIPAACAALAHELARALTTTGPAVPANDETGDVPHAAAPDA